MIVHTDVERNKTTQARWKDEDAPVLKFIDDGFIVDKINLDTATPETRGNVNYKIKHAKKTQNIFRHMTCSAENKGMKVNSTKTNMLLVSDKMSYTPEAYIEDEAGSRISSTNDSIRILGFHVGADGTPWKHVRATIKNIRQRYWVLWHLRSFGFNQDELVKVYTSTIRPLADYCSVVYHSALSDEMDEALENAQNGALRIIFGPRMSARKMREASGLDSLRNRRIEQCDRFADKAERNPRFSHWFPKRERRRSTRNPETYLEATARCERLRNLPLFYMRRRKNGKEGKLYGQRYRVYREK